MLPDYLMLKRCFTSPRLPFDYPSTTLGASCSGQAAQGKLIRMTCDEILHYLRATSCLIHLTSVYSYRPGSAALPDELV